MAGTLADPITVMKRHELKYLLDAGKTEYLKQRLVGHMHPDGFGLTTIASLYYDTPDRRLIRASLERPEFKEKLRLRSYGPATESSPVFLELKCKAGDLVYKRRVQSTLGAAEAFFDGADALGPGQIEGELAAFRELYEPLCPVSDEAAHLPQTSVRQLEPVHRAVQRVGHVLERVQQRAVEIK